MLQEWKQYVDLERIADRLSAFFFSLVVSVANKVVELILNFRLTKPTSLCVVV